MLVVNQIFSILDKKKKIQFFLIFLLMAFSSFLEILSIGMIFPILSFLSGDVNNLNIQFLDTSNLNFSADTLFKYSIIIFCLIYILRSIFLFFLAWIQNNYIFSWKVSLSNEVFRKYMLSPYIFHLSNNSSSLYRNTVIEVDKCVGVFNNVLAFLLEALIFLGVLSLLIFLSFEITLKVFLTVGTIVIVFILLAKKKIKIIGLKRHNSEKFRLQYLKQGLNGIKDIIISNKVLEFTKKFEIANKENQKAYQIYLILQKIPRLAIESAAVLLVSFTTLSLFKESINVTEIIPIIGVFVLGIIRLVPAANKLLMFYNSINFDKPALKIISEIFEEKKIKDINNVKSLKDKSQKISFNKELLIKNVSYKYPNNDFFSVRDSNIKINKGDYLAFIGKSGSGKTTLTDIILGLLDPQKGEILVDGININKNLSSWRKLIGYVPQQIYLTDDSLKNNIAYGIPTEEIDINKINDLIKKIQLDRLVQNSSKGLDTTVGEFGNNLSGGEKQRIGIARALYNDPQILFLDESTNSLDKLTENQIFEIINNFKKKMTIILITHEKSLLKYADRVLEFQDGNIREVTK